MAAAEADGAVGGGEDGAGAEPWSCGMVFVICWSPAGTGGVNGVDCGALAFDGSLRAGRAGGFEAHAATSNISTNRALLVEFMFNDPFLGARLHIATSLAGGVMNRARSAFAQGNGAKINTNIKKSPAVWTAMRPRFSHIQTCGQPFGHRGQRSRCARAYRPRREDHAIRPYATASVYGNSNL